MSWISQHAFVIATGGSVALHVYIGSGGSRFRTLPGHVCRSWAASISSSCGWVARRALCHVVVFAVRWHCWGVVQFSFSYSLWDITTWSSGRFCIWPCVNIACHEFVWWVCKVDAFYWGSWLAIFWRYFCAWWCVWLWPLGCLIQLSLWRSQQRAHALYSWSCLGDSEGQVSVISWSLVDSYWLHRQLLWQFAFLVAGSWRTWFHLDFER